MVKNAFKLVYSKKINILITFILFIVFNVLFFYLLVVSSSWDTLWGVNSGIYNYSQIITSILTALLSAIALNFGIFVFRNTKSNNNLSNLQTFSALLFSAATTGCYVCGTVLLPTLGLAASLTALPFGGLEVKVLTILLLSYTIYEYSKNISGKCKIYTKKLFQVKNGQILFTPNKESFLKYKPLFITVIFFLFIMLLPVINNLVGVDFANHSAQASQYSCLDSNPYQELAK